MEVFSSKEFLVFLPAYTGIFFSSPKFRDTYIDIAQQGYADKHKKFAVKHRKVTNELITEIADNTLVSFSKCIQLLDEADKNVIQSLSIRLIAVISFLSNNPNKKFILYSGYVPDFICASLINIWEDNCI